MRARRGKTVGWAFIAGALLLGFPPTAHADLITTLYNTGVNDSGVPLANAARDTHYDLISGPALGTSDSYPFDPYIFTGSGGGWPINPYYQGSNQGPWIADNTSSAWVAPIAPIIDSLDTHPVGTYTYRTTFDLTGLNPGTAVITGRWSTDNTGPKIVLNANDVLDASSGYSTWYDFDIDSGFISGINTLDFVVWNASGTTGNPTGLRVEMTGTANIIPEPASLALLGVGLVGIAFRRKFVR